MAEESSPVAVLRPAGAGTARRAGTTRRGVAAGSAWKAVEQERRRWARELHDETLQNLAGLMLRLSSARRGGRREVLAAAVDETVAGLQQEIANLRSLITDLRPAALDELGIEAAIAALARRAARNGLKVELSVRMTHRRGERFELDTTVYRIVQEALTNAQKHGRARCARVEVRERRRLIEVSIRDDGEGFDPGGIGGEALDPGGIGGALDPGGIGGGLGLLGMRERVEELGGTLHIDASRGRGVAILATLPLHDRRPDEAVAHAGRAA